MLCWISRWPCPGAGSVGRIALKSCAGPVASRVPRWDFISVGRHVDLLLESCVGVLCWTSSWLSPSLGLCLAQDEVVGVLEQAEGKEDPLAGGHRSGSTQRSSR